MPRPPWSLLHKVLRVTCPLPTITRRPPAVLSTAHNLTLSREETCSLQSPTVVLHDWQPKFLLCHFFLVSDQESKWCTHSFWRIISWLKITSSRFKLHIKSLPHFNLWCFWAASRIQHGFMQLLDVPYLLSDGTVMWLPEFSNVWLHQATHFYKMLQWTLKLVRTVNLR